MLFTSHLDHGLFILPQLTPEEEERRGRRRERNKVAAQKCRDKKSEQAKQLTEVSFRQNIFLQCHRIEKYNLSMSLLLLTSAHIKRI